jgi:hypothetical protein
VAQHGTLDQAAIRRPINDENDLFRWQALGQLLSSNRSAIFRSYTTHVRQRASAAHQLYDRLTGVVAAAVFVDAVTPSGSGLLIQRRKACRGLARLNEGV